MKKTNWLELYQSMEILECFGKRIPEPTDAAFDRYEEISQFRLPLDYREFMKVFGPGALGGFINVRAPGYRIAGNQDEIAAFNWFVDLEYFDSTVKKSEVIANDSVASGLFKDVARLRRCIYFADTAGGDVIGWDPEDLRNSAAAEYGVYAVLADQEKSVLLADSFPSFVLDVCLGTRWGEITSPSSKYHEFLPRCFRPQSR